MLESSYSSEGTFMRMATCPKNLTRRSEDNDEEDDGVVDFLPCFSVNGHENTLMGFHRTRRDIVAASMQMLRL